MSSFLLIQAFLVPSVAFVLIDVHGHVDYDAVVAQVVVVVAVGNWSDENANETLKDLVDAHESATQVSVVNEDAPFVESVSH